jgi:alanyl-tRNA synthetase
MVEKLYLTQPYLAECDAVVTDIADGRAFLSRTIFFPEGGGQVGDTGTVADRRITDTQKVGGLPFAADDFPMIMVGGEVAHYLGQEGSALRPGQEVRLTIDWARRYRIMRYHSAAHLAYWFATQARPDLYVKGCRIDESSARFDFRTDRRLESAALVEWEGLSNDAVAKDLEIANAPVESQPEALMWYCADMRMPCGGTHVRSTAEVGPLRLQRKRQGSNLERLYIYLADSEPS